MANADGDSPDIGDLKLPDDEAAFELASPESADLAGLDDISLPMDLGVVGNGGANEIGGEIADGSAAELADKDYVSSQSMLNADRHRFSRFPAWLVAAVLVAPVLAAFYLASRSHVQEALLPEPDHATEQHEMVLAKSLQPKPPVQPQPTYPAPEPPIRSKVQPKPTYLAPEPPIRSKVQPQPTYPAPEPPIRSKVQPKPTYPVPEPPVRSKAQPRTATKSLSDYASTSAKSPQSKQPLNEKQTQQPQFDAVVEQFRRLLKPSPKNPQASPHPAATETPERQTARLLAKQREDLRAKPKDVALLNNTAWTLATSSFASVRNGSEAVKLARQATDLSQGREPAILGTLAAAYAESGQFAEAVATARKASALATEQHKMALAKSLQSKLPLYEKQTPYREMLGEPNPTYALSKPPVQDPNPNVGSVGSKPPTPDPPPNRKPATPVPLPNPRPVTPVSPPSPQAATLVPSASSKPATPISPPSPRPTTPVPPPTSKPPTLVQVKRVPIPDEAAQRSAAPWVRKRYDPEYARAKTSFARAHLAQTILAECNALTNEPSKLYVMLSVAREVAIEGGDRQTAYRAVDAMARSFLVDADKLKAGVEAKFAKAAVQK